MIKKNELQRLAGLDSFDLVQFATRYKQTDSAVFLLNTIQWIGRHILPYHYQG